MITASVKLTEEQMLDLRRAARAKRMTLSDFMRAALLPEKKPKAPPLLLKRHPVSGAIYNAAPGQLNPTLEEIAAIMEDFP